MQDVPFLLAMFDALVREATLFAAVCFLFGGIDDVAVDLVYLVRRLRTRNRAEVTLDLLPRPASASRLAVFVAAWDESQVIGAMLRTALARFDHPDYRLYVGTYPNDRPTVDAVAAVAEQDQRVRLVIGAKPGPTTKADCLNAIWAAMVQDEAHDGVPVRAVILHDAEDVVHAGELRVYEHFLANHAVVQLPVLPLRHPRSRIISGHYLDEFAEAHAKTLLVREAVGAGLPLAGVGCAIDRAVLADIARKRGGLPFDPGTLTEDYELGLTVAALGRRAKLAWVREYAGGPPVAIRAYFPHKLAAAVRQKSRWLVGIALAGWDRIGWARAGHFAEHWMRMRDRRATLAVPVLVIAYCALMGWGGAMLLHLVTRTRLPELDGPVRHLLQINVVLLAWRVVARLLFVRQVYGWTEARWSVPRLVAGDIILLMAGRRAAGLYIASLLGKPLHWEKTDHQFPTDAEQPAG